MVMAKDTCKLVVTKCPSYGEFLESFVRGLHKTNGIYSQAGKNGLPQPILKVIFMYLEVEWNSINSSKLSLAMEGAFYATVYCCALRGEQVILADLCIASKNIGEPEKNMNCTT
jgi:hypothetical protein